MKSLTLDSFIASDEDIEINQYRILSGLKEFSSSFNCNKLYPSLSNLIFLSSQLEEVLHKKSNVSLSLPKGIKDGKYAKNAFVELVDENPEDKNYMFDLIEWALPIFKDLIHEAYILYDFIDESIEINDIGISSLYKNEGYMFVQDNQSSMLRIFQYECSDYSTDSKPFYSLKTKFVDSANPINYPGQAEYIKSILVKKYNLHPNVSAFHCKTELDFPFSETIFPIAKRKLLGYISDLI